MACATAGSIARPPVESYSPLQFSIAPDRGLTVLPLTTDLNLTPKDIAGLVSADAVAAFFQNLGYNTGGRKSLTPQSIGLAGDSAAAIKSIELLSEDREGFLRVVFVQLKSLTAKSRNDLARLLGRTNVDHLLVLSSNFDALEFVLLDKRKEQSRAPGASGSANGSKNASSSASFRIWHRAFSKIANSGSVSNSRVPTTSCETCSKPP